MRTSFHEPEAELEDELVDAEADAMAEPGTSADAELPTSPGAHRGLEGGSVHQ